MSALAVTELAFQGLKRVTRTPVGDHRGYLSRLFSFPELSQAGWDEPVVQINHTCTFTKGTVRGFHFQRPPCAEKKLVSCIHGEILDIVIDIRRGSPTFLQWHAEHLSADNGVALLIPEGCAHGFQTLSDSAELIYCHSAPYSPQHEGGIHPLDPELDIHWPLPVLNLSDRDKSHPFLDAAFTGILL